MAQAMESIETKIGYTFRNQSLCDEALTTAGVLLGTSAAANSFDGNASLALIGDSILRVDIASRSRQASQRMDRVANNNNLASIFDTAHLGPHVTGNPSQQGMIAVRTKATVVEALLGAVYEDSDIQAAFAVIRHLRIE
ncbi:hypothetical protein MCOR27_010620 [Pyricularia oryzae]|nr:hypothetical protein MCOR01_000512 [Pyricularia oryzae]KAI6267345.1 hypothetical protein MCOR27_010620 [Pyricularia oryzae]KAI6367789.1 hypothetical protein MCOR32_007072 [Pyricularia oryzae]KAI6395800.1 hypothetical protein MCOR23_006917 [Pyricularia oryzae]KAI6482700.1 hypothetical protein MCOR11_010897 [Pyricularia oryzae]